MTIKLKPVKEINEIQARNLVENVDVLEYAIPISYDETENGKKMGFVTVRDIKEELENKGYKINIKKDS